MKSASDFLKKADEAITGDRAEQHGDMTASFHKIALLWNAYLSARRNPKADLTSADVAWMMVLFKISRSQTGAFNDDDFVDAAGYSGIAGYLANLGNLLNDK
jgi:hypothetical protein